MLSRTIYRIDMSTDIPGVTNTIEVFNEGALVKIEMHLEEASLTASQAADLGEHLRFISDRIKTYERGY
jgi:hypothetical protein